MNWFITSCCYLWSILFSKWRGKMVRGSTKPGDRGAERQNPQCENGVLSQQYMMNTIKGLSIALIICIVGIIYLTASSRVQNDKEARLRGDFRKLEEEIDLILTYTDYVEPNTPEYVSVIEVQNHYLRYWYSRTRNVSNE